MQNFTVRSLHKLFLIFILFTLMNIVDLQQKTKKLSDKLNERQSNLPKNLVDLFGKFCYSNTHKNVIVNKCNLLCYCKKDSIFKHQCGEKYEIFNTDPFMAIFRGPLKVKFRFLLLFICK